MIKKILIHLLIIIIFCFSVDGLTIIDIAPITGNVSINNSNLVPYNGATNDLDMGIFDIYANNLFITNMSAQKITYNSIDINSTGTIGLVCQEDYIWKFNDVGIAECKPDSSGDLTNYYTKSEVNSLLSNKINVTKTYIPANNTIILEWRY